MRNIVALGLIAVFFAGCASFRTQMSNLADEEFQARETAKHVLSRALDAEPWKSKCQIDYNLTPPTVSYLAKLDLYEMCGATSEAPVNGCYDTRSNRIYIKNGFSWGNGQHQNILRAQFKTLVHEYLHFYVLANKLSPVCMSELISHYGTWAGTDSIVFYRFSL